MMSHDRCDGEPILALCGFREEARVDDDNVGKPRCGTGAVALFTAFKVIGEAGCLR